MPTPPLKAMGDSKRLKMSFSFATQCDRKEAGQKKAALVAAELDFQEDTLKYEYESMNLKVKKDSKLKVSESSGGVRVARSVRPKQAEQKKAKKAALVAELDFQTTMEDFQKEMEMEDTLKYDEPMIAETIEVAANETLEYDAETIEVATMKEREDTLKHMTGVNGFVQLRVWSQDGTSRMPTSPDVLYPSDESSDEGIRNGDVDPEDPMEHDVWPLFGPTEQDVEEDDDGTSSIETTPDVEESGAEPDELEELKRIVQAKLIEESQESQADGGKLIDLVLTSDVTAETIRALATSIAAEKASRQWPPGVLNLDSDSDSDVFIVGEDTLTAMGCHAAFSQPRLGLRRPTSMRR